MKSRVLVVDDWKDSTESLAMLLEAWRYEVRTALNGESALQIADRFRPNVVILDLGMPQMDGFEVARRLRRDYAGELKIICVSGYGAPADRQRTKEAGFDHHLLKPADPDELQRLLQAS
jgi:CheY-like chemotaxis protein